MPPDDPRPVFGNRGADVSMPCTMVIFGASGDLTRRKLIPALYNLDREGLLDKNFAIVGYARSQMTTERFREEMRVSVDAFSRTKPVDEDVWNRAAGRSSDGRRCSDGCLQSVRIRTGS